MKNIYTVQFGFGKCKAAILVKAKTKENAIELAFPILVSQLKIRVIQNKPNRQIH